MHVAFVCTDRGVPLYGNKGASVHVESVLRALHQRGDEVRVLTTAQVGTPPPDLQALEVHRLPARRGHDPATREKALQEADAHVWKALSALHARERLDLVYERFSLWGRTAMAWAGRHGVPAVLEVNSPLVDEQAKHRVLVDRTTAERFAREALSTAGTVVCVSDTVATWARQYTSGRVHTVANGVDTSRIRPPRSPVTPSTGAPFTVGFVGTLKPWHGVETLCEAFALLVDADPAYRLLIVGDGPLAEQVRDRLTHSGVSDQAEMTGAVGSERIPALLQRMDVATAPYPPLDGFYFSPLKVYEYLAAGVPIVASRVGDLAVTLDDGRLGVLTEPGHAGELAAGIAALRASPARRDDLRRAGRRRAVERHDWSQVVGTTLSLAMQPETAPLGGKDNADAVAG